MLMWRRAFAPGVRCPELRINVPFVPVVRAGEGAKPGRMQRQHSLPVTCSPSGSDACCQLRIRQDAGIEIDPPSLESHDG